MLLVFLSIAPVHLCPAVFPSLVSMSYVLPFLLCQIVLFHPDNVSAISSCLFDLFGYDPVWFWSVDPPSRVPTCVPIKRQHGKSTPVDKVITQKFGGFSTFAPDTVHSKWCCIQTPHLSTLHFVPVLTFFVLGELFNASAQIWKYVKYPISNENTEGQDKMPSRSASRLAGSLPVVRNPSPRVSYVNWDVWSSMWNRS